MLASIAPGIYGYIALVIIATLIYWYEKVYKPKNSK